MPVNGFDEAKNKVNVYTTIEVDTNKQAKHIATRITLLANQWIVPQGEINIKQFVNVEGVTDTNTVLVSPVWAFAEQYSNSNIYCIDQSDGELTFLCYSDNVPQSDIVVDIIILGD